MMYCHFNRRCLKYKRIKELLKIIIVTNLLIGKSYLMPDVTPPPKPEKSVGKQILIGVAVAFGLLFVVVGVLVGIGAYQTAKEERQITEQINTKNQTNSEQATQLLSEIYGDPLPAFLTLTENMSITYKFENTPTNIITATTAPVQKGLNNIRISKYVYNKNYGMTGDIVETNNATPEMCRQALKENSQKVYVNCHYQGKQNRKYIDISNSYAYSDDTTASDPPNTYYISAISRIR